LPSPAVAGQSYAYGINDRGDIVGMWDNGHGPHAMLWLKQ
jgi:hypothetical protein